MSEREYLAFGLRVRTRRLAAGLSQQSLADRAGLHRVSIARIETAGMDVPFSTMIAIANALEVSVADLLADLPTETEPTKAKGKRK